MNLSSYGKLSIMTYRKCCVVYRNIYCETVSVSDECVCCHLNRKLKSVLAEILLQFIVCRGTSVYPDQMLPLFLWHL